MGVEVYGDRELVDFALWWHSHPDRAIRFDTSERALKEWKAEIQKHGPLVVDANKPSQTPENSRNIDTFATNEVDDQLPFVIQYRRKFEGVYWTTMAAFDAKLAAENYLERCREGDMPWEYRVINRESIKP